MDLKILWLTLFGGCGQAKGKSKGQRSEDRRQKSVVRGQRTEARGQRDEGRGQRSENGGQRSEVRERRPEVRNRDLMNYQNLHCTGVISRLVSSPMTQIILSIISFILFGERAPILSINRFLSITIT